jgi:tRNA(Arg) A34 adenosine deaminase TadA
MLDFMESPLWKTAPATRSADPALVVEGLCVDSESNSNTSDWRWTSHAEHRLIMRHSAKLRRAVQVEQARVELFSTFEPCLMCLGTAVFSRIRRIVYAATDQNAGATCLDPRQLGEWYSRRWPLIQGGLLREQSEAFAHTLGREVVPITRTISDVPSDIGHHRALEYLPNAEGLEALKQALRLRLGTITGREPK